jgi:predicted glutamine amidotransferase
MCRIFAFRAENKSQVHHSLITADNALMRQSLVHPDGWGIAYYAHGIPHLIKSLGPAQESDAFQRVSSSLVSDTVVAHIRRRTQGDISLVNCHPFQAGRWVMAHNGDVPGYPLTRDELIKEIDPEFLTNILGTTDSEIYFAVIMQELKNLAIIDAPNPSIKLVAQALRSAIAKIEQKAKSVERKETSSLNVVISNGTLLLAYRQGRQLNWSAHCHDNSSCTSSLGLASCANARAGEGNKISHLLISSEPLMAEPIWEPFLEGQIIAVDHEWRLWRDL